jgi:hypothetical protein
MPNSEWNLRDTMNMKRVKKSYSFMSAFAFG